MVLPKGATANPNTGVLNLTQGSMTVEQYSNKFVELSRYALNLVLDEEAKTERFL